MPKKKRRKKAPDANVPPPDTAQHAIYVRIVNASERERPELPTHPDLTVIMCQQKLKSRRINYEVIDELFGGEAASSGF